MSRPRTTLERAFDLADSGEFAGLGDIKARLRAEGYRDPEGQLYGPALGRQLRTRCDVARKRKAETV